MNARKITAIVLLILFVLSLPLSLAAANFGGLLFNQQAITTVLVDNLVSDRALPGLIHEITVLETLHGPIYKPFDARMLVNVVGGIPSDEWVQLLGIVLPEKDRIALMERVTGGVFAWLDNNQPYPDITIPVGSVVERVGGNTRAISAWIFSTFVVPACDAKQAARYQAGDFGTDVQALVTCKPPAELKDRVVAAAADAMAATIAGQAPPSEIRLADLLKAQIGAEQMLAQKAQLNVVRRILPWMWILPTLLLLVAIALVVRCVKDLVAWLQWPLFVVGLLGTLLVLRFGNPAPMITAALLPPPEAIVPTPVAAILLRVANALFSQVMTAMLWVLLPLLVIGAALLVYSYRASLKAAAAGLLTFLRSLVPPRAEARA